MLRPSPAEVCTSKMSDVKKDGSLRYIVISRSRPGVKHVVELEHYDFNGVCSCESFTLNLEKFLKHGISAETAARGVEIDGEFCKVKLKNKDRPQDSLRCPHLVDAWMEWAVDSARVVVDHEKNRPTPKNPARPR